MIPAAAVKDYMSRKLDSFTWIKSLSKKELIAEIDKLQPKPQLYAGLHKHQLACFLLGVSYPQFCFFLDMGCVDGDTEYLSPTGWVPIKDYKSGKVAQYDPYTRKASFVEPLRYINRPCKEFVKFKTARGCDQVLTPEHRMLVVTGKVDTNHVRGRTASSWKQNPVCELPEYQSKGYGENAPWFYDVSAEEMADVGRVRIETTFELDGSGFDLTDDQLRVQVAVHADGTICSKTRVCIRIKKNRKKVRLRALLQKAGIEYAEKPCVDDFVRISFIPPKLTKKYGADWYSCTTHQKEIICDEVGHWDGSFGKSGGIGFSTGSKLCADFIQFCFSSTRRRAYMSGNQRPGRNPEYWVHAIGTGRTGNLAYLGKGKRINVGLRGRKYCFEVPTHYLVLRRNGNVFITGNTGKTAITLELLKYWVFCGRIRKALVFITSDKAFHTWQKQIEMFNIGLPYVLLEGPSVQKRKMLNEFDRGLVFISYPGLINLASKNSIKKGRNKWVVDDEIISELAEGVGALVLDESTKTSAHTSLTHWIVERLKKTVDIRYALAGRPFGRDPTALWAQHYLIDNGETLGSTLGMFREAFFYSKPNPWVAKNRQKYVKVYEFNKSKEDILSRMIQHRSISYSADECIDLPKSVKTVEKVGFSKEALAYYDRARATLLESRNDQVVVKNMFLRMRQLSSGFVGYVDDETGERAQVEFSENPKLELLLEILEQIPLDRKAVCFYDFTWSGRNIYETTTKLGFKPIWIWSGTKDFKRDMQSFTNNSACRLAVVQNRVGAFALDGLQVANYSLFYESPVSVIDREQAERRTLRQGQTNTVFQYDLVTKGSVDLKVLEFHREGESLMKALLRNPSMLV